MRNTSPLLDRPVLRRRLSAAHPNGAQQPEAASAAHLTLLGDGPDQPELERLMDALGLAGRVSMLGFVADVTSWHRRARVMVLPSIHAGLPAAVLEALASNQARPGGGDDNRLTKLE